jgi:integrase
VDTRATRWGRGSLRKRPGRDAWELRVSAGRDPLTRRYRYVSRSFRGSKKEAEVALAQLLTEVSQGRGGLVGADTTLAQLVEAWLELKRDSLSPTTWEGYAGKARFRLIPALGDIPVRKLTVEQIDRFYRALSRDASLSASTIRQLHNILTGSLDQAIRWHWRSDNPARLATLPPVRSAELHPPSPDEVMSAIASASPEFAIFLRVAAAVGGRRGEIGALRWLAVDLESRELVISRALIESSGGTVLEKDTKSHQARRVALDEGTVTALAEWKTTCVARANACGIQLQQGSYVFSPEVDGSVPWKPFHWTSAWRRVRAKSGIDRSYRLHDLRHFAATRLLNAGVPVRTVSNRLGHARPATTLNIYAHFVPASDHVAAEVLGGLLDGRQQ